MKTDVFKDIEYLYIDLPEDIRRLKDVGNFDEVKKIIDLRLEKISYEPLRRRLALEKHILDVYEKQYIYTLAEAYKYASVRLRDFTFEELLELVDKGSIDYIYKNKKRYLIKSFYDNIVKTVPSLKGRVLEESKEAVDEGVNAKDKRLLDIIAKMKEDGEVKICYEFETELKIKDEAVREGARVYVHLPVPMEGEQISEVEILSNDHQARSKKDNLAQTVYFEKELAKDDVFKVRYSFVITAKYNYLDADKGSEEDLDFCVYEKPPHIVFTPYLKELYKFIVGDEKNKIKIARKIYDYITQNVNYSYLRPYITYTNIPEYTAVNIKGDCGFQALLFITLCRMAKIPAIWQSGMYATEEGALNHDWARFYIEPYSWVYADASFGNSGFKAGLKEKHDFYFGNLDPFRLVFNNDYYVRLDPAKKQYRKDPFDNQSGEVEYDDYGLNSSEFECKTKLIKKEIL